MEPEKNGGYGIAEFFLREILLNRLLACLQNLMCLSVLPQLDTMAVAATTTLQRYHPWHRLSRQSLSRMGNRAQKAGEFGVRVVMVRIGLVLGLGGGLLNTSAYALLKWESVAYLAVVGSGCLGFMSTMWLVL